MSVLAPSPPVEPRSPKVTFDETLARVRAAVDDVLRRTLETSTSRATELGGTLPRVVASLAALTMRGGKRFRAGLLVGSYEACGGEGGVDAVVDAAAALEFLQVYMLVHDDWMDGDELRRDGPSVHADLRRAFGDTALGDASAILAGDFASALAQRLLGSVRVDGARLLRAQAEFARIQEDVVFGQLLDMHAGAADAASVERMHQLKTGSYTVRGPLAMGALLAGASESALRSLERFAEPLGVAFQLRDDLLGAFGSSERTGKPSGSDFRQGKRTSLVIEVEGDERGRALLAQVFGRANAPDSDVDALRLRMVECGAKNRVEARLEQLLDEARARLRTCRLTDSGTRFFEGAVDALGERER
ncbi:MAG: polyprenyl synthetase family protein [Polyangiaceae bacterium]